MNILFLENNQSISVPVKFILKKNEGWIVTIANSYNEALKTIKSKQTKFDAIICDHLLSDWNNNYDLTNEADRYHAERNKKCIEKFLGEANQDTIEEIIKDTCREDNEIPNENYDKTWLDFIRKIRWDWITTPIMLLSWYINTHLDCENIKEDEDINDVMEKPFTIKTLTRRIIWIIQEKKNKDKKKKKRKKERKSKISIWNVWNIKTNNWSVWNTYNIYTWLSKEEIEEIIKNQH